MFQDHQLALEKQDFQLKEKTREQKRLKENFDTLKSANDTLRKEVCFLYICDAILFDHLFYDKK